VRRHRHLLHIAVVCSAALTAGCASAPSTSAASVSLPLRTAWFEGHDVRYVTTDVSDAAAAAEQGVNFVPRLAEALGPNGRGGLTERVYKLANFEQRPVFQSAPRPLGARNADAGYSPLWRLVLVTWTQPAQAQELRSEEAILAAEERGWVTLRLTSVVLNCPILAVDGQGSLAGVR